MAPQAARMNLRYRAAAKLDLQEARDWYEAISPALEERFGAAVANTLTIALDHPRAFPVVRGDSSRHPRSWQGRR